MEIALTDKQIAKAFEAIVGMPPRGADVAVMKSMGAGIETLAEYIWDHWMGEPDEPTQDQVEEEIRKVLRVVND